MSKAPKLEHSVVAEMFIFETLNFVPKDKNLIEKDLMSTDEIVWLNEYHSQCREKIRAHLDENERIWLDQATNKL